MDEPLNKPVSDFQPIAEPELRDQIDSIRQLAISIMVLVLVVAGAFDLYLLRQVKYANQELSGFRPQAERFMSDWQKQGIPFMENFLREITQYGQTHPDFAPILSKYNLKPQIGPTPATSGTSTPVLPPKTSPIPKK